MTIEEAAANIGRAVIYQPTPEDTETGVITTTSATFVFVRYGTDQHSKATSPHLLGLVVSSQ